jgi:ectoine hydroxylase-related dioxygenase (phytanoyl-CoA dioxygenase family)
MRGLTAEERSFYDEQGYVIVPGVLPAADLASIDAEIERLLPEAEDRSDVRPGWIFQLGLRSEIIRAFAEDERLLALVEEIVQPGIALEEAKLVAKPPHSPIICHWHQDEAFYQRPDDPGTASNVRMAVWMPLQDADERNGCLWVVPGSHRWGLRPWDWAESDACRKRLRESEYAEEHAIPVRVKAGDAVLFSSWTWHHSEGNLTDVVRRAFIVTYQEASILDRRRAEWKILRPASAPSAVAM